jgi:hypothetical protein
MVEKIYFGEKIIKLENIIEFLGKLITKMDISF